MIWRSGVVDDAGMKNKKYNFLSDSQTVLAPCDPADWLEISNVIVDKIC